MKLLVALAALLASTVATPLAGRISGGNQVSVELYPYMAALRITPDNVKYILCGGALISSGWILTSASCVDGALKVEVVLGLQNISAPVEPGRLLFEVSQKDIIIHEKFKRSQLYAYDIALIELPSSFEPSSSIYPIALPSKKDKDRTYVDKKVLVLGYGAHSYQGNTIDTLKLVKNRVISYVACKLFWMDYQMKDTICTDTKKGSICAGDQGGPLIYADKDGDEEIIGIALAALENCDKRYPAVFTRVTLFRDWIVKKTGLVCGLGEKCEKL